MRVHKVHQHQHLSGGGLALILMLVFHSSILLTASTDLDVRRCFVLQKKKNLILMRARTLPLWKPLFFSLEFKRSTLGKNNTFKNKITVM